MPAPRHFSTGRKPRNGLFVPLAALLFGIPVLPFAAETEQLTPPAGTIDSSSPITSDIPSGRVARAIFTTAIADREPVDQLNTLSNDVERVFFFSDLRELAGQIVTHRWEYGGQTMAEVIFKVGDGARWRVYSSKNLLPEWTGTWTVVINNESGQALQTSSFEYTAK
jgi:Protein of unknown function (DUF2914)